MFLKTLLFILLTSLFFSCTPQKGKYTQEKCQSFKKCNDPSDCSLNQDTCFIRSVKTLPGIHGCSPNQKTCISGVCGNAICIHPDVACKKLCGAPGNCGYQMSNPPIIGCSK